MTGNREAYQQYMEAGHNAAWDREWQEAIQAYTKAAREFPEDSEAHVHLGLALFRADRLDEALKVYVRAQKLAPDDPVPVEMTADILERVGKLNEAAQYYVRVSDIYLGQRDLKKAIGNWERATQLSPGLVAIHAKLAQAYERIGDKRAAIRSYLTLAYNFRRGGATDKAVKAVERALRLDKNNSQALNAMSALRSGAELQPVEPQASAPRDRDIDEDDFDFDFFSDERDHIGESDPLGPMGEAMHDSLGILAAYVVESGSLDSSGADALQAMELQRQEYYSDAIECYLRAEKQLRHPALKLSLGVLLLLEDRYEEALKHLDEATMDPALAAGAMHALGLGYHMLGKQKQASRYLIQSLQAVDSSLTMSPEEDAELASVYDRLYTALEDSSDEAMTNINERFIKLLSGKDWKQRIAETRRHLDDILREGGAGGVRDFLGTSGTDKLTESISRIDNFIRQNLLVLAMDEAHFAVEYSPNYLPLHVRMAEILMREGRVRQAINKYNLIAKNYITRDEVDRASGILTEVLELAPLDISVRRNLIDLLEGQERYEEALRQYIDLGQTYNDLGNFDGARDAYQIAQRVADQIEATPDTRAVIMHRIADLDQMRLDMRSAQKAYEKILQIKPDDEEAYRKLVEIYFNQGNQVEAMKRLDQLLGMYAKQKQVSQIVQTLEELVRRYPKDSALRSRMAGIYRQLGRKEDAIAQLDALGELQLESGQHGDAVTTIKQIIKLKPANIEEYRRLLQELGG